jgi:dolichyl-phosphate beta-glucosyltransferase
MRRAPDVSVVIPAYNEERRLATTVRNTVGYFRARDRMVDLIVVDDGSRDGTSDLVRRLSGEYDEVRLIRLAANRGKGYAVRTGVLNAMAPLILFCDADESTPIQEIERLERALDERTAVAIGSREVRDAGVRIEVKLYRRVLGRTFHQLVRLLTVRGYQDTQCGFKLFRASAAQDLFSRLRMDGYAFDVELLMLAELVGYKVAEVAVTWTHKPGSQVRLARDSFRMARDLLRIRLYAMRGEYAVPHVAVPISR